MSRQSGGRVRGAMAHMSSFVWLDWPISLRDEDHAEPHFQCKAINAGRIASLEERIHKAHSSEVRSMSFAEPPRCKRPISMRTVFKRPKQVASPGPNLAAARRERLD